jgi:hypothetical protein
MRGSNGPSLPRAASTVSAPTTSAASSTGSNDSSACSASAVEVCVPLISARPSFAASRSGAMPAVAQRVGSRYARAVDQHLAFADQRQGHVGERREVAGRADRALRRHIRHEAGAADREQRVDHRFAHAGMPARQARRLQHKHQSDDRWRQRLADADAVGADQVELQAIELVGVDARRRQLAEAGVDAIDRRVTLRRALDDGGAGAHGRTRGRVELEACAAGMDRLQRIKREVPGREAQRRHQRPGIGRFRACS